MAAKTQRSRTPHAAVTSTARFFSIAFFLSAIAGPAFAAVSQHPTALYNDVSEAIVVQSLDLEKEKRVSRTEFDYTFKVRLKNISPDRLESVELVLDAIGSGSSILDGNIRVNSIAGGEEISPPDTITIRHNRSQAFAPSSLHWRITAANGGVPGVLLPGAPESQAIAAIPDYEAVRSRQDLITARQSAELPQYYLTQLRVVVARNATVGEVNSALQAAGARIVWSMMANPVMTVQVPMQGSLEALEAIAEQLEASSGFDSVTVTYLPEPALLPRNVSPELAVNPEGPILNHLGVRLPAAWNSINAPYDGANVEVIIVDYFGRGTLENLVSDPTGISNSGNLCDSTERDPCRHGYHVIGIMGADFNGASGRLGAVTGSLSQPIALSVVDISDSPPDTHFWDRMQSKIADVIKRNPHRKFIINLSLGACIQKTPACFDSASAQKYAVQWREWARSIKLSEDGAYFSWDTQVLQISAAGNNEGGDAKYSSVFNAAALLANIRNPTDQWDIEPLANSLVVEARGMTGGDNPSPTCRKDGAVYSNVNGTVAGIGSKVFSFLSPTTADFLSGTSMATPQVAGVAAWMAGLRPDWSLGKIKDVLRDVRFRKDECSGDAPLIDAYAAILALDKDYSDAPIRMAILKKTSPFDRSDAKFGFSDAKKFLEAYFPKHYGSDQEPDIKVEYSEYDLNGDGYTGGASRAVPFDVKFSGEATPFIAEMLEQYEDGSPIEINEAAVTDFEILCFYVHSPLFDNADRTLFEEELSSISRTLGRPVSCNSRVIRLNVSGTYPGWEGLPAKISMSNFVSRFPANPQGNSTTCTNQGEPPGERGYPLFSAQVPSIFPLNAAIDVTGVPTLIGRSSNRRNCSSFFATTGRQVWINATARTVFGFGSSVVSDWEFQVRYSNGDPVSSNGKQCTIGLVPGSGVFTPSIEGAICEHYETARVAQ